MSAHDDGDGTVGYACEAMVKACAWSDGGSVTGLHGIDEGAHVRQQCQVMQDTHEAVDDFGGMGA